MPTIYIGRSVRLLNLKKNRVYKERPETLIKGLEEKYPLAGQLFVDVTELSKAQKEVEIEGSPRNLAYKSI